MIGLWKSEKNLNTMVSKVIGSCTPKPVFIGFLKTVSPLAERSQQIVNTRLVVVFCSSFNYLLEYSRDILLKSLIMVLSKVLLSTDVALVCTQHALSTEKEEIMGLLIGEV